MSAPIRTAAEVVEVLATSLLTRKGEVIDEALAYERARNAAAALMELVQQARWHQGTDGTGCHMCGSSTTSEALEDRENARLELRRK